MKRSMRTFALVLVTLAVLAVPAEATAADDFSSALGTAVYGPFEITASNDGATKEPDEPDHAGGAGGHSLWWTWQPAANGTITIDTCASDFDTLLAVYTGDSVDALTEVASNDDGCGAGSKVSFTADVSNDYRIAVDGSGGETGNIVLRAQPPAPPNDDFGSASSLSGLPALATGTNTGATKQVGEPDHAGNPGGRSVWWSWTASSTGAVTVDTCDSDFDTLLAVYTGEEVGALTEVASSDDDSDCSPGSRVTFEATSGRDYRIVVDGYDRAVGNITLKLASAPAPPPSLHLALGDSVSRGYGAGPGRGFVDLYFTYLEDPAHGGVAELENLAIPGETSSSMLSGGQLDDAVDLIRQGSDTQVVTLSIGGNDGIAGHCPAGYNEAPCPFKANYTEIVSRLSDALSGDPGIETVQAMQYYNPASGTATPYESVYDYALLGSDGRIDCSGSGRAVGLNDHVACIGRDYAVASVDTHPTFKAGGQPLMADAAHPNDTGHAYIACLFEHPERAGSAKPCEASVPVVPPGPGGTDSRAPTVAVSGARRQRVLRKRRVSLVVETDEDAVVTVAGKIAIPPRATVARLRPVTKRVAAHSPTKFSLRLTRKSLALVRRALRRRRTLTARVTVRVRDSAGNSSVSVRRVRLVR